MASPRTNYFQLGNAPFGPFTSPRWGGVVACGLSLGGVALALVAYFARMALVTAGYHRYFAHRAFKTSRAFQFVLAVLAQSSAQKGVLWWASHHRHHHKTSDTAADVHSPAQRGSGMRTSAGSCSRERTATDLHQVPDWRSTPSFMSLNSRALRLLAGRGAGRRSLRVIGGSQALVWGFFVSTVLLWHGSFTINSLAHLFGSRRYATSDNTRNNWLLAIATTGEGWHNNHHHYQSSANQGFFWWEIDLTYYLLRLLQLTGRVDPSLSTARHSSCARLAVWRYPPGRCCVTASWPSPCWRRAPPRRRKRPRPSTRPASRR